MKIHYYLTVQEGFFGEKKYFDKLIEDASFLPSVGDFVSCAKGQVYKVKKVFHKSTPNDIPEIYFKTVRVSWMPFGSELSTICEKLHKAGWALSPF